MLNSTLPSSAIAAPTDLHWLRLNERLSADAAGKIVVQAMPSRRGNGHLGGHMRTPCRHSAPTDPIGLQPTPVRAPIRVGGPTKCHHTHGTPSRLAPAWLTAATSSAALRFATSSAARSLNDLLVSQKSCESCGWRQA
eukprot:COSAG01_NODE_3042_length_6680_cov_3.284455_4_plen_138_part_00